MYSNGNNIIEVFHAPDLKMGDKSSDPKYIENIRIDFNVTIQIFIFDDKYKHFQGNEEAIFVNNPLTKAKLLQFSNNFYIHTNEYVEIKLSRTVKKVIRHGFKEYLGIPPEYEEQYILKGEYISRKNKIFDQQQDPAATILGSLGVIGGAWGVATVFYATLFGVDNLRPWGILQTSCFGISRKTKHKLTAKLSEISETQKYDDTKKIIAIPQNQINAMQKEIKIIRMILHEYVIDMDYLEKETQTL
ncbi:hypothetical protein RhiirA4_448656 [Rhizophagus irregularis]|uniref:Uncharacterized protein n=1 Tax=Rhizophagus irregularis TaxID=588596 RepID=A0A2I1HBJ5_9GLOM|nr:hypothetical protein RhiirA4_448656 [Rhizophagus irregularis]